MAHPMKRLPPLPALHTFLITAQCCNFTRAAQQLHLTQGAVSRQIAGLEEHLGYPLFIRQARGLSLTREGQEWLPRVQQVFAVIEEGTQQIGAPGATLQLKAPSCVMRWLLPRLMEWQTLRPDVPVELTTAIQHGVDFRREGFDAAVLYGAEPEAPPAYTPDWAERCGAETLFEAALRHLTPAQLESAASGDVLLFRMHARAPIKHCAILDQDGHIIHAYWGRAVVRSRFAPWWRARCAAAFSFPNVSPWQS